MLLGVATVALYEWDQASKNLRTAQARQILARGQLAVGQPNQLKESLRLTLDAWERLHDPEALLTLRAALALCPLELRDFPKQYL